jgi:HSP20 family protein
MDNINTHKQQGGHAESERLRGGPFFRPRVDILESEQDLTLLADMPGTTADNIEIEFENGQLTIHGKVESRRAGEDYLLREYGVGHFMRTFKVGESIDVNQIKADYSNGVLRLTLPKSEAAKPRKVSVQSS